MNYRIFSNDTSVEAELNPGILILQSVLFVRIHSICFKKNQDKSL